MMIFHGFYWERGNNIIIYNALIIGSGNIGAFFDNSDSKYILTHAHGFIQHEGFNLVGFYDINHKKALNAANRWNCKAFKSIKEAFSMNKIDIVCVAVPDELHYQILKVLSNYSLKIIFVEKPLTKTMNEAKEIYDIYRKKEIDVCLNYSRRYVPEYIKLKEEINRNDFGSYICGTGYYGKGILHNGSHIIDLLRYLIGEIYSFKTISGNFDFYEDDPSVTGILLFNNEKEFLLRNIDCNLYTIFEIDLFFEKNRIRITDSGFKIEIYEKSKSSVYKGYKYLTKSKVIDTDIGNAVYWAIDNIYNFINGNETIKCNIIDGLHAVEISNNLKDDYIKKL